MTRIGLELMLHICKEECCLSAWQLYSVVTERVNVFFALMRQLLIQQKSGTGSFHIKSTIFFQGGVT